MFTEQLKELERISRAVGNSPDLYRAAVTPR